jgi:hypothetical protein
LIQFSILIGFFSKLLKAADKFLQKFNIRRLKFGTIIEFLDKLGMVKSKEAMARVMITIKVCNHGQSDDHNQSMEARSRVR